VKIILNCQWAQYYPGDIS